MLPKQHVLQLNKLKILVFKKIDYFDASFFFLALVLVLVILNI